MKLSSITIKNYRALDEITLSLNPCMNVLYGTNGAGKSSILYALHDFLGLLFSQEIAPPDFRLFPGRAVREHNRDTAIGLCFSNGCTVSATLRPDVVYREPVTVASGWRQSCQLADGTRISHFPDFDVHACSFFPGKSQDNIDAKFLPTPSSLELRVQERPPLSFTTGVQVTSGSRRVLRGRKTGKIKKGYAMQTTGIRSLKKFARPFPQFLMAFRISPSTGNKRAIPCVF